MLPCVEKAEHERAAKFCELRMQRNINATDRTDAASNGANAVLDFTAMQRQP